MWCKNKINFSKYSLPNFFHSLTRRTTKSSYGFLIFTFIFLSATNTNLISLFILFTNQFCLSLVDAHSKRVFTHIKLDNFLNFQGIFPLFHILCDFFICGKFYIYILCFAIIFCQHLPIFGQIFRKHRCLAWYLGVFMHFRHSRLIFPYYLLGKTSLRWRFSTFFFIGQLSLSS